MAYVAVLLGIALLIWSADKFVTGASAAARQFGMPALLIGMLVVGFGTSAPEIVVSLFAALDGNPGLALGNAYGSNIVNISLILGITALITPVAVTSKVLRKELPILTAVTALAGWQLTDGELSRSDALVLLIGFVLLAIWQIRNGLAEDVDDALADDMRIEITRKLVPLRVALTSLAIGFVVLVISSRMLVWGAVEIALALGLSDLVVGLTIVAIGTSLPELASSIVAARKGEHDLALGNVIGSNLFNTLLVVGIAGAISPTRIPDVMLGRDWLVMAGLTVAMTIFGIGLRRDRPQGRINRIEGGLFVACFVGYTTWLLLTIR
ncbi:MAG: calcium/sodium antiporter [Pseudomonadota bacterium]